MSVRLDFKPDFFHLSLSVCVKLGPFQHEDVGAIIRDAKPVKGLNDSRLGFPQHIAQGNKNVLILVSGTL